MPQVLHDSVYADSHASLLHVCRSMAPRLHSIWVCVLLVGSLVAPRGVGCCPKTPPNSVDSECEISNSWEPWGQRLALPVRVRTATHEPENVLVLIDMNADRSRPRDIFPGGYDPAWSPNGSRLAYALEAKRTVSLGIKQSRLSLYDWRSKKSTRVTKGHVDRSPTWSTKYGRLAFARLDFDAPGSSVEGRVLVLPMEAETVGPARSVAGVHFAVDTPVWSPSAERIAFVGHCLTKKPGLQRASDIYIADPASGPTQQITHAGDVSRYSLDWSPDGKFIAYADGFPGLKTITIVEVDTGVSRVVVPHKVLEGRRVRSIANMRWSPDGRYLVFDASKYSPGFGSTYLGLLRLSDFRFRWLTNDQISMAPRWSPTDKKQIMYVRSKTQIWTIAVDGGTPRKLYDLSASGQFPPFR